MTRVVPSIVYLCFQLEGMMSWFDAIIIWVSIRLKVNGIIFAKGNKFIKDNTMIGFLRIMGVFTN